MFKVKKGSRPPKRPSSSLKKVLIRAKSITRQLDEVKPLYRELDELTIWLMKNARNEMQQYGAVLVDNFADKNTQFKTVGIRRYELKWR